MVEGSNIKNTRRQRDLTALVMSLAIILLGNYIASFVFERFDLTSEKRYSLTEPTKKVIRELDDIVFFKVYLEGEFPAGFKRLRDESIEMLNEFRAFDTEGHIEYEFINPSENPDEEIRNNVYRELYKQGLRPTDLEIKDEDGISKKIIWPGAIVTYRGREVPVDFLQSRLGASTESVLNSSIENLEYVLSNAIQKLTNPVKPKIAFIEGHGELGEYETADIAGTLAEYYSLERVNLDGQIDALTTREENAKDSNDLRVINKYNVIVIAKPDSVFSEKDKFIIDQFLMYGGKILWLIDPMQAEMDSLTKADVTMGLAMDLKLDDILFNYGVRLNANLIMDIQSAMIPLPVGMLGNQPKYELFPWYYFPLLTPVPGNNIVNNLNVVKAEFASTIDFVGTDSMKKEVLLTTSPYTKLAFSPVRISLGITRFEPQQEQFNQSNLPVAVLLEGRFRSNYKDRLTTKFAEQSVVKFKERSQPTKMIVVADGDVIRNHVRSDGQILPLGVDRFTGQEYGNKDFIVNVINYLCDEEELMVVRSRSLKIRMLDKTKIDANKLNYQLFNMIAPLFLVLLFGLGFNYYRKKKYTTNQ
jgi:ABC-2 type transport system permease protein